MALGHVNEKTGLCLELLQKELYLPLLEGMSAIDTFRLVTGKDPLYCPFCKKGHMRYVPSTGPAKMEPG